MTTSTLTDLTSQINGLRFVRIIIYIIFFTIPFQIYLNFGSAPIVSGYLLTIFAFALLLLAIPGRGWKVVNSPLFPPLILLGITIILSLIQVVSLTEYIVKTLHFIFQVLLYILILNVISTEQEVNRIVRILLISGLISSWVAITLFFLVNILHIDAIFNFLTVRLAPYLYGARAAQLFAINPYFSWVRTVPGQTDEIIRATGLFVTPAENGYFSACIFFIALGLRSSFFKSRRKLFIIILVSCLINILLAQTRGVWLGMVVGLMYYIFNQRIIFRPYVLISMIIFTGIASIVVIAFLGTQNLLSQFNSVISQQDSSASLRVSTMLTGIGFIKERALIIGVGPGNQDVVFNADSSEFDFSATTHSMYVDLAIGIGLLGLLAYLWLLWRSWKEAVFVKKRSPSQFLRELSNSYHYMVICLLVIHVFQGNLFGNPKTNLLVWGVIGLISVARRISLDEV